MTFDMYSIPRVQRPEGYGGAFPWDFTLNILRMSVMCDMMREAGVLVDVERKRGGGLDQTHPDGVPAFKFGSNDGWIVNPDECRMIARGLRGLTLERVREMLLGDASIRDETVDELVAGVSRAIPISEVPPAGELWPWRSEGDLEDWIRTILRFAEFCERSAESGDGFEVC